jgi:beta-lactamase class A
VTDALRALEPDLAAVPGTVSVWCGRLGRTVPAYDRNPEVTHYAASTMKTAVMAAVYRLAEAGSLDLDAEVPVHDDFASATGTGRYHSSAGYDNDPEPWERLGHTAPLRWLVRRMIVRSSNLATNLVLERTGFDAVAEVWRAAGALHSTVGRGIQDYGAQDAGLTNLVTAADLAGLITGIATERLAGPRSCQEMLDVLHAQEVVVDVVAGLPPGTRVAHKNGWVEGIRHSSALIEPDDAPPYVFVTCVSAPVTKDEGCAVVAKVAAASWADRTLL